MLWSCCQKDKTKWLKDSEEIQSKNAKAKSAKKLIKTLQCKKPKRVTIMHKDVKSAKSSTISQWELPENKDGAQSAWSSDTHVIPFKPSFKISNLDKRPLRSESEWSEIHYYQAMMKKRCHWLSPLQCWFQKWRPSWEQMSLLFTKKTKEGMKRNNL